MQMKNFRYDVMGASLDYGISIHPQEDMKRLGFRVVKSEPVIVADCWWFRVEYPLPSSIPGYLHEMMDSFRFSDESHEEQKRSICIGNSPQWRTTETPPEFNADGSLTDYGKYVRGIPFR